MKKFLFLLIAGLNVLSVQIFASKHIQINEYVSLSIEGDEYIVEYTSPYFELREKEITAKNEKQLFSQVVYGDNKEVFSQIFDNGDENIENAGDFFDYTEEYGAPEIPFFSLDLHVPNNTSIETSVIETSYFDMKNDTVSSIIQPFCIPYKYIPSQVFEEDVEADKIQFDETIYNEDVFNPQYRISEVEGFMGSEGVTFTFYPLIYHPIDNTIIPIAYAKYRIKLNSSISIEDLMDITINDDNNAYELTHFYDNYKNIPQKSLATLSAGHYMIITTNKYVATLGTFINHKSTLGYQITTKRFAEGTSAVTIRNFLRKWYRMYGSYPKFTLIVGNYDDIPFSYGVIGDADNPPTDIYYACLEKEEIGTETNFKPETIVGRWPVRNSTELTSVINKTKAFDNLTNITRRFSLFSGTGDGENSFASDITSAYNKIRTTPYSTSVMYDGRNGFTHTEIINEFLSYNDLLFVYRGHGGSTLLGSPYTYISTSYIPSHQAYFTIGLACQLNWPADYKFGNKWINNGDRACGIYASTTNSNRSSNSYLSKHLFSYYTDQATNLSWGEWMSGGAAKYYSALSTSARKKETKKYLILGDPSLYLYGFDSTTRTPKPYQMRSNIENANDISNIINSISGENIENVDIYDITGHLLTTTLWNNNIDISANFSKIIAELQSGTYIISVKTSQMMYSTKICK